MAMKLYMYYIIILHRADSLDKEQILLIGLHVKYTMPLSLSCAKKTKENQQQHRTDLFLKLHIG